MAMVHLLLLETVNLHKELKIQNSLLYSMRNQTKIKIFPMFHFKIPFINDLPEHFDAKTCGYRCYFSISGWILDKVPSRDSPQSGYWNLLNQQKKTTFCFLYIFLGLYFFYYFLFDSSTREGQKFAYMILHLF